MGIDARWEHLLVAVDANGNITEQFPQWDSLFRRPHAIYINPYDPQKHVWVVDDHNQMLFEFTNDLKQLVKTIGTKGEPGADDKHFNRPTFLAWLPDSTMFVADGYNGTRVVKFDKDGKFLLAWGQKGTPPNETRPGYFNVVHGIAVDPVTRRVYVSDRGNRRMQVFDENGKFLDQWPFANPSSVNFLYIGADRHLWAFDDTTSKIVRYDPQGHLLYAWGGWGIIPEVSSTCTAPASIRKAISTWPRSPTAERRSSIRGKAPIRNLSWASLCMRHGNKAAEFLAGRGSLGG